ncbi:STAS domain-containing protein [Cyanobium sp. LEGE 06143]|uniref:SulP family inorganic anion transporter n=1 Tax=Cyanobium sp. LEGE 06143 TaxID=945727 RepID=UPI0018820E7C|nr:SulP family inorganic anion transporter [Cyanobium sp. LEGE 06143]MBE9171682.1 STAS domain-containing protein [Cyanobium sp. LEGE 06143]
MALPFLVWLRSYRPEWLRFDLVAGLTAAAVVLPKALAFATIAGLPVEVGLYTALVPMLVYALLGSSRPLSVSTTTTLAILVGSELDRLGVAQDPAQALASSSLLALLLGLMLLVASLLRLGFVASFISESVLVGFKSAIGVVIVVDQLPKLLGVSIDKLGLFRDLAALVAALPQASMATVALSLGLVALLIGLERRWPRLPAPLLLVVVAILLTAALGLPERGVAVVGAIPSGLPAFQLPFLNSAGPSPLALANQLWPAAAGIAVMSFTESAAASRAFREMDEPAPNANQDLLALGAANLLGACFGAMAAGGGTSQTAVNRNAGARTQLAALVTAAATVATLLVLAPLIALMPQAALAVVVIAYALAMIAPAEFLAIRHVRAPEFRWAVVAFLGVVFLGTLEGILVAVVLSLLSLAQQEVDPAVYEMGRKPGTDGFRPVSPQHPEDETWPGLLILHPEGRLFFANAEAVASRMRQRIHQRRPRVVVLDGSAVIDLEYSALKALVEAEQRLRRDGTELWMAGLNPEVLQVVRRSELGSRLGPGRLHLTVERAVERFLQHEAGDGS